MCTKTKIYDIIVLESRILYMEGFIMLYISGSSRFVERHMTHSGRSGGGTLLVFIISFFIILLFSGNIFIAGLFSFIIAGIFSIFGG